MDRKRILIIAGIAGVLILAVAAIVFAMGGEDEPLAAATSTTVVTTLPPVTTQATSTSTTVATTTTTAAGPPSLLNGMPVEDPVLQERRIVAVKVDNHPEARPQSGIQEAGAVMELIVEAGITRFIALFHDTDSEYIGPIRSGRPTDPTLVKPLDAVFQISGAQPWVQGIIRNAGVTFLGESSPNTFRIPRAGRAYERTLYGSTLGIREVADARGEPDEPPDEDYWFTFGDEPTPTTETAVDISLSWSAQWPDVRWVWDGEQYLRFNGETEHSWVDQEGEGEQISADTLVVLTADQYTASGSSGSAVPALDTLGTGDAFLFYGGEVVRGTWERGSIDAWFTITSLDGDPFVLPPGRLWVNIFPDHRPVTWDE